MNNNIQGFTLIELMIVVAVLGVVATLAVPSFASAIKRHQLSSHTDNYFYALRFARAEAIRTSESIEVVPIANGDWNTGLVVKFPDDASGVPGEKLRLVAGNKAVNIRSGLDEQVVLFNGKGYLAEGFTMTFCEVGSSANSKMVEMLSSGFAAIKEGECQ